ncbi:hypothetical protein TCDM_08857 [Trypanosoma cruzi Dm28c]|uniref:Uncharacterized protein n=1 Tax=Trypanosoma cruzi Dm28c TaxID=1416333 RepID=V5ARF3_TRYCR|nr:hypothetical protein TCDM_08857 [Trypanosoma cruzi Dm28c]
MPIVTYLWTRRIHVQRRRRNQRKLLTPPMVVKKWQRGCPPLIGAEDGSPSHSTTSHYLHRTADAPPDVMNCPTQLSRRAMEVIRKRRSTVVRRIADISALGQSYEESERGRSRDVGAVNVEAWNVSSGAIQNLMPHARTADERGELRGLFGGNIRCGAIDPTAVRQDAAVHVGNVSNPAGHDDYGVTKNCGAIGDEAGSLIDNGRDESIYPQPDQLEATCCLTNCVGNGEMLVRDCRLNPQKFHTGGGREP